MTLSSLWLFSFSPCFSKTNSHPALLWSSLLWFTHRPMARRADNNSLTVIHDHSSCASSGSIFLCNTFCFSQKCPSDSAALKVKATKLRRQHLHTFYFLNETSAFPENPTISTGSRRNPALPPPPHT